MAIPDLSDFAGWVDKIEAYAHVIFLVLIAYYTWLLFKGGDEGKTAGKAWGMGATGAKKIGGWFKKGARGVKRAWKREEKLALAEYVDLEQLKKAVNNPKVTTDAGLKKAVGSAERRAKRHESKAYNRLNQLQKTIADMKFEPKRQKALDKILNEMTVFTKQIVDQIREFDLALDAAGPAIATKKAKMTAALDKAITADRDFVAKLEEMKKVIYA